MAGAYSGRDADMAKMMKIMIYVSPLMMLFFLLVMFRIEFVIILYLIITIGIMSSLKIILSTV
jgi:hypothetical protein